MPEDVVDVTALTAECDRYRIGEEERPLTLGEVRTELLRRGVMRVRLHTSALPGQCYLIDDQGWWIANPNWDRKRVTGYVDRHILR